MPARRSAAALTRSRLPASGRLDQDAFLRPIAHRGLHAPTGRRIENTAAAFLAAIDKGYGIECDLQPASDGTPMVFHDEKLDRLVAASGPIAAHTPAQLARLRYQAQRRLHPALRRAARAGRRPGAAAGGDQGQRPRAADGIPRQDRAPGQVLQRTDRSHVLQPRDRRRGRAPRPDRRARSGGRQPRAAALWWAAPSPADKARILTRMLRLRRGPRLLRRRRAHARVRAHLDRTAHTPELALFSWTIRTARERATAARWADAPIFEGYEA